MGRAVVLACVWALRVADGGRGWGRRIWGVALGRAVGRWGQFHFGGAGALAGRGMFTRCGDGKLRF